MVATLSETYDTLFSAMEKEYTDFVPADALLWWWTNSKFGLRVEAPQLMVEFTDNMYIGRDPAGHLFFYDSRSFGGTVKYDVTYSTTSDKNQRCYVIKFYLESPDNCFAKFIAKDPNGAVNYTNSASGIWQPLTASSAAAHIVKESPVDGQWTMTVPSINKKCTWSANSGIHDYVDTWGMLTFKQIDNISKGVYVDYKDDRIIFTTTNEWDKDFCAYLVPVETKQNPQPLGAYELHGISATWSNI